MKLTITQFAGERPIVASHLLPENAATKTLNARMEGGSLVPMKGTGDTLIEPAPDTQSWAPYPFQGQAQYMERTDEARFVRGPLANDAYDRVYAAGDGEVPEVFYRRNHTGALLRKPLGIKAPNQALTIGESSKTQEPISPEYQMVRCTYVFTYLTAEGEESAPSPASEIAQRWDGVGGGVNITYPPVNDSRAHKRRLYRSEGGGEYLLVGTYPMVIQTDWDYLEARFLGEPVPSDSWNTPPERLLGLTPVGSGFFAAYHGNTLYFSEPYYPHAWPVDYELAFPDDITGIAVIGGAILVTTKTNPWFVSGSHPSAMTQSRVDILAPCLSDQAMVDMGDYALYPSTRGLVAASPGSIKVITGEIFSREQWLEKQPETFKAFRYRDQYLCFGATETFLLDLQHGIFPISLTDDPNDVLVNAYYKADVDVLYLLIKHADDSLSVKTFDTGENRTMLWRSREFVMPNPSVFSSGRLDGDGSVDLQLSGDGYSFSKTVTNDRGFRLPSGRPRRLQITLQSSERINSATLASSMGEIL